MQESQIAFLDRINIKGAEVVFFFKKICLYLYTIAVESSHLWFVDYIVALTKNNSPILDGLLRFWWFEIFNVNIFFINR